MDMRDFNEMVEDIREAKFSFYMHCTEFYRMICEGRDEAVVHMKLDDCRKADLRVQSLTKDLENCLEITAAVAAIEGNRKNNDNN